MAIAARRPAATGAASVPAPVLILALATGTLTTGLNLAALGPLIRPIGAAFRASDAAVGQLAVLHALVAGAAAVLVASWIDRAADFAAGPNALSALFLAGGLAGLLGSVLFPTFLRLGSAARVYGLLTTLVAAGLLGVVRLGGPWVALLPPMAVVAFGMAALYLATTALLLDARPGARGAVMALQTGTFEAGSALGSAAAGGLLTLAIGYRDIFGLCGLVLLSLACVWRGARPPRRAPAGLPAAGGERSVPPHAWTEEHWTGRPHSWS